MWEQPRYLACMVYNMNITKRSQSKKPQQLFKLPQDNLHLKDDKNKISHEEMKKFKEEVEELQAKGKFTKEK